jgi:hypothetical protein
VQIPDLGPIAWPVPVARYSEPPAPPLSLVFEARPADEVPPEYQFFIPDLEQAQRYYDRTLDAFDYLRSFRTPLELP